jgi:hypothetical protein
MLKYAKNKIINTEHWQKFLYINKKYQRRLEGTVPFMRRVEFDTLNAYAIFDINGYMQHCLSDSQDAIHQYIKLAGSHIDAYNKYLSELSELTHSDLVFCKNAKHNQRYNAIFATLVKTYELPFPVTDFVVQKDYLNTETGRYSSEAIAYTLDELRDMILSIQSSQKIVQ